MYSNLLTMHGIVTMTTSPNGEEVGGAEDIYNDEMMSAYLQTLTMNMDVTPKARDCILQWAKRFEWEGN